MTGERVLWVTGGGSGIGRAVALAAAARGWNVAVSGRSVERLEQVAATASARGVQAMASPMDVTDTRQVAAAAREIGDRLGRIDAVVHAAGANSSRRVWADQSMTEFEEIVHINLIGAAATIDAALPRLRERGGSVILVASQSAWTFNGGAGVAYSASKAGLSALCRTLNDQEHENDVRASCMHPGDVATDFLLRRPTIPDAEARSHMLTPEDVARAALFILDSPARVRIDELVITPVGQV